MAALAEESVTLTAAVILSVDTHKRVQGVAVGLDEPRPPRRRGDVWREQRRGHRGSRIGTAVTTMLSR